MTNGWWTDPLAILAAARLTDSARRRVLGGKATRLFKIET